jgi:hypothetical protein
LATIDIILAIIAVTGKHDFCHVIEAVAHLVYYAITIPCHSLGRDNLALKLVNLLNQAVSKTNNFATVVMFAE